MTKELNLTLKVWRQDGPDAPGAFETIEAPGINDEMSFLEMLDLVNERLISDNKEAVVFDHDCREGICGTCSLMINGQAHGPQKGTATCQLHMRKFVDGETVVIEPWRATAFPVIKDLAVDRGAHHDGDALTLADRVTQRVDVLTELEVESGQLAHGVSCGWFEAGLG